MFSPLSWRSFFWKSKLRIQKHYKKNLGMVGKFHLWVHVVQQQQVISITLQLWMITNTENIFCCFKMLRMRKIDLLYIPWSSEVHSPMLTLSSKEKQTWLLSTPFPYLCILLLFPRKHCLGMKYLWRHYNFYCLFCCCTTTGCMKGLECKNYVNIWACHENLSWKHHICHIASKISISIGIISRLTICPLKYLMSHIQITHTALFVV